MTWLGKEWRKDAASWLQSIVRSLVAPGISLGLGDSEWRLTVRDAGAVIRIPFSSGTWVELPQNEQGCATWDGGVEGFRLPLELPIPAPGLAATRRLWVVNSSGGAFHYDVLALAWWMLARVEEIGRKDLDEHGRFPAASSHAFRHGYLERPIVDEWFTILRQLVQRVWPGLQLTDLRPSTRVSHDVDAPSRYAFGGTSALIRSMAGDLIRRRDLGGFLNGPLLRIRSRSELHPADPSNTFDWIMDRSDEQGLVSAFYFICGRTDRARDALYDLEDRAIRALLRRISKRGHEIGLHPSYGTFREPGALVAEAARLKRVCAEEGISQPEWGGRMHFLRWETPTTLHGWEQAGMAYDSSMSYADRPGFRCGTCHEYPAFDPVEGRQLHLRIRPLVAMECTVMAPRYMGLGDGEKALEKFIQLKRACHAVGGCFTTLWHNTYFEKRKCRDLYQSLLAA